MCLGAEARGPPPAALDLETLEALAWLVAAEAVVIVVARNAALRALLVFGHERHGALFREIHRVPVVAPDACPKSQSWEMSVLTFRAEKGSSVVSRRRRRAGLA